MSAKIQINEYIKHTGLSVTARQMAVMFFEKVNNTRSILKQLSVEGFLVNDGYYKDEKNRPIALWAHTGKQKKVRSYKKANRTEDVFNFISSQHLVYTRKDIREELDMTHGQTCWAIDKLVDSKRINIVSGNSFSSSHVIDIIYIGDIPEKSFSGDFFEVGSKLITGISLPLKTKAINDIFQGLAL